MNINNIQIFKIIIYINKKYIYYIDKKNYIKLQLYLL